MVPRTRDTAVDSPLAGSNPSNEVCTPTPGTSGGMRSDGRPPKDGGSEPSSVVDVDLLHLLGELGQRPLELHQEHHAAVDADLPGHERRDGVELALGERD